MYNFCTYFDKNYLLRGLTLYRSLADHLDNFTLYILCLDEDTYGTLQKLNLKNIILISLATVEKQYPELLKAKTNRKIIEYYFTLTPVLPSYILDTQPDIDQITYLDADLFFYSHPQPIYDEMGNNSILIIPHRFPKHLNHLESKGLFNVQFIVYRNDTTGRACLAQYKAQCLEWCYDRDEPDRYADQKYLDQWPKQFSNVTVLKNKGAGLAPWNWMQYDIKINEKDETAFVDDNELIFYHFHGIKIINSFIISHGLGYYGPIMPRVLKIFFYSHYVKRLKEAAFLANSQAAPQNRFFYSDIRYRASLTRQILSGLYRRNLMLVI